MSSHPRRPCPHTPLGPVSPVIAADPNDDWETELGRDVDWREQLIAELDGKAICCIQIIDPAREAEHYWGDVPAVLQI